ncbi:ATP-binding protein [Desulforegula conservatrix]|uniref:ATP-binding protein n=1 Tax=Desulforegula conservatrix TaxID=153026 RepID=UPI0003F4BD14|nr:ATP-binding protein [Desulforegula conservatrix]
MDGFKRKIAQSLQVKISVWLSTIILIIAVPAVMFSFLTALHEANELQDDQLRQIAGLIDQNNLQMVDTSSIDENLDLDPDNRLIVQWLGTQWTYGSSEEEPQMLPGDLSDGMHTLTLNNEDWRMFVRTLRSGKRLAVCQQIAVRDEIMQDSALRTLMPFIAVIPVIIIFVGLLVRQMFKPVIQLSSDLYMRAENDLSPINNEKIPDEVRPFIDSVNCMFVRVKRSMDMQNRFVTDAAHELRSPLTALMIQADQLGSVAMSLEAKERLETLQQGMQRMHGLLNQLLTLARVQGQDSNHSVKISVQAVLRRVLEDLMPLAEAKNIDIGLVREADAMVMAPEVSLIILIRNIVDNAIKYSPQNGRIDINIFQTQNDVSIEVVDNGPGISSDNQERVFDPFYRVLGNDTIGSGLGLSIVKAITDRLGGAIFFNSMNIKGLSVTVKLPSYSETT